MAQSDIHQNPISRRAFVSQVGTLFGATVALAACGGAGATVVTGSSSSSASSAAAVPAPAGSATKAAAAPAAATVQLTATNWSSVSIAALDQKVIDQFQQANPTIKVSFAATTGDYWTKMQTQAAGGDAPDVFWMNAQNLGAWAARKQLRNLSPYAATDKYDFTDFWKAGIAAYTVSDTLLALPSQVDNRGLFFNASIFQTAGASGPATDYATKSWDWAAFLAAAQHATAATAGARPSQYGCIAPNSFITYAPWVWANGGHFMNSDRTTCAMTSPETVETFQYLQDLIHKYQVAPGPDVFTTQSAVNMFSTGKIGMVDDTIAQVTPYRQNATHFTWDTGALPSGKAGFANQSSGPAWAVEQASKYPDQSWVLSKYLVAPEAERTLAQGGALLPSRVSIANEVWGKPVGSPAHPQVFLEAMNYVHPNPFVWNWNQIETMLIKELSYLWDGSKTAQAVMQAIAPQMNTLLQQKPS